MGACYWERLSDLSGEFSAILANGNGIGPFYLEVVDGDHALTTACPISYLSELPTPVESFPTTITPGDYLVGITLQPGLYKGEADEGLGSCYWERRNSFTGEFGAIIANGNGVGPFYFEVAEGDFGLHIGCEVNYLSSLPEPADPFPTTIGPGDYLVGIDIQPGTYRGEAGADESCYWERLNSFSGGFNAIVANGNGEGQFFAEAQPGDVGFRTACELTLAE